MPQPFFASVEEQNANPIRRINQALNTGFRVIGDIPGRIAKGAVTSFASPFTTPENAQRYGEIAGHAVEQLPRLAADVALYSRGGLGKVGTLADVATQSYSATPEEATLPQQLGATALGTGAFVAAPAAGQYFSKAVSPLIQGAVQDVTTPAVKGVLAAGLSKGASLTGTLGAFEAANAASSATLGQFDDYVKNFGSAEHLIGTAASVLPFEAATLPHMMETYRRVRRQAEEQQKNVVMTRLREDEVPVAGGLITAPQASFKPNQLMSGVFGNIGPELLNEPEQGALKLRPDKQGMFTSAELGSRLSKLVPPTEWEMYKSAGLEDFLKSKPKVTGKEVQEWMERNGPKVEVRTLSDQEAGKAEEPLIRERAQLEHKLDTLRPSWRQEIGMETMNEWPEEVSNTHLQLDRIDRQLAHGAGQSVIPHWQSIAPKPESEMPGYAELFVKLPEGHKELFAGNRHTGMRPNVLGWSRGYMDTLPNWKKVWHVVEVQSDWGQRVRELEEQLKKGERGSMSDLHAQGFRDIEKLKHPLLKDYNRLVLKATIDHAIKNGADAIAVSDAETAMMTEGHDQTNQVKIPRGEVGDWVALNNHGDIVLAGPWKDYESGSIIMRRAEKEEHVGAGWKLHQITVEDKKPVVAQEPGMRLNYDRILPKIVEELTGEKGKKEVLGEHKNAMESPTGNYEGVERQGVPRSNLIFKNPDGSPKTAITAHTYDLSKTKTELAKRGGFPLVGGGKFVLSSVAKEFLGDLEKRGLDANQLSTVASLQERSEREVATNVAGVEGVKKFFPRLPNESKAQHIMRILGIDQNLYKRGDPQALMKTTHDLFQAYGRDILQLNEEANGEFTRLGLRVAAGLGRTLGESRVIPAEGIASYHQTAPEEGATPLIAMSPYATGTRRGDAFKFLATFAHELFHANVSQGKGWGYGEVDFRAAAATAKMRELTEDMTTEEMQNTAVAMFRAMFPGRKDLNEQMGNVKTYSETPMGRNEFMADTAAMYTMGTLSPRESKAYKFVDDLAKFAPKEVREFITSVVRPFAHVLGVIKDVLAKEFLWSKATRDYMNELHDNMTKVLATDKEADAAVEMFLLHNQARTAKPYEPVPNMDYHNILTLWHLTHGAYQHVVDPQFNDFVKEVSPRIMPQENPKEPKYEKVGLGTQLKIRDFFKALPQLVRDFPNLVPTARLGRSWSSLVSNATMGIWDTMKDPETGKYDIEGFQELKKKGSPLASVFNKIALKQNEVSLDGSRRLTGAEMNEIPEFAKLSQKDKELVQTKLNQSSAAVQKVAWMRTEVLRRTIGRVVGRVLMSNDIQMSWEEAEKVGDAVMKLNLEKDRVATDQNMQEDIARATATVQDFVARHPKGAELLTKSQEVVDEAKDAFFRVRSTLLGQWIGDPTSPKWDGVPGFEGKPGYLPEVRLGRFHLAWREKGGKSNYIGFKSKKEFQARLDKLNEENSKGKLEYLKAFDTKDKEDILRGARPDVNAAMIDLMDKLYNAAITRVGAEHPEEAEAFKELRQDFQPSEAWASSLENPYMRERRLVGGREELNFAEGLIHYVNNSAHNIAKQDFKSQRRLLLNDPKLKKDPNLQANARKYLSEIIDPTGNELTGLKQLAFFNYLGFNPSQSFVELTQQFSSHVPALVNAGMGLGEAYRSAAKALADSTAAIIKGKTSKAGYDVFENAEESKAVNEAIQKRVVDAGWLQEIFHLEEDVPFVTERNYLTGDGSVLGREGLVGKPLYHILKLARNAYSISIRLNTEAAFLSSFRHFRQQGKSYQEAFNLADDLSHESMYGGGRASRPLWFLGVGKYSPGSTVGGVMYMLQSYTYNAVAQQARYLSRSIAGSSLTGQERLQAGKAAASALTAQIVLAGVMGIPLGSQVFALVEQFFPGSEPKRRMRELFFGVGNAINHKAGLFKDDETMGHLLSDAAMDGLLNVGPFDLQSRFQLGGLMGVDPYKGFSWDNVIGPTADMLSSWIIKAPQAAFAGDVSNFAKNTPFVPSNIRRFAGQAIDGFNVRGQDGRLNVELTKSEAALQALGFKPKRVAEFQKLNEMQQRAEAAMAVDQKAFHTKMAGLLEQGQIGVVRQLILQRAHEVSGYDPRAGAQAVADLVLQRRIPFDPTRETSRIGRTFDVGQFFPRPEGQVSEVQRLMQKHSLTDAMGFVTPMTKGSLREAQMVDQFMQMYGVGRSQAKGMLEQQLRQGAFRPVQ